MFVWQVERCATSTKLTTPVLDCAVVPPVNWMVFGAVAHTIAWRSAGEGSFWHATVVCTELGFVRSAWVLVYLLLY